MKRLFLLLACCGALLAGCSLTRMGYDHLGGLLRWEAGRYVYLTAQEDHDVRTEMDRFWTWHRRTQLRPYAADLRALAEQVQSGPLSVEQLAAFDARVDQHWDDLVEAAVPGYVRVHAELDDAQVAEMIRNIGKEVDRKARKRLRMRESERRDQLADDMEDRLRQWIGRPNAQQEQLVEQWAAQVQLSTPQLEALRRRGLDRYAALLASRGAPGFDTRVRDYFQHPEDGEVRAHDLAERARWRQLLSTLSATLEPSQREHLHRRLLDYADDFEALAAEGQDAGETRAASLENSLSTE